jgi:dipeptidyl aminopeptidase/acylaminoacyl peptidase
MPKDHSLKLKYLLAILCLMPYAWCAASQAGFSMAQALQYPYTSELVSAERGDVIAWVRTLDGVRNVWLARGPAFAPLQITHNGADDGQEITQLTFSPDGSRLVFVRGGDHDANWPAEGNLSPDPASSPVQPETAIWSVPLTGGEPVKLAEGDAPAVSAQGQLAYVKDDHVWTVPLDGGKPERLFFDRGKDGDLCWSPDGSRLAFVSHRGDHAFIGIFASRDAPLVYLAPSTGKDGSPRWSPDGTQVAFVRRPGDGGPPQPVLKQTPHPWSIWIAAAGDGRGRSVWQSPKTLAGSFPDVEGGANLHWMGDRLIFLAYLDDWPHLYAMPASGGAPVLLTPGAFMVEHVAESRDHRFMIYDANTGTDSADDDRRHVFRVAVDHGAPAPITSGAALEWTPVGAAKDRVAFVAAGAQTPPAISIANLDGSHRVTLAGGEPPADFPVSQLVTPKRVIFQAADGVQVHGQLFTKGDSTSRAAKPGVIFVHGGPPRQMLLGWSYMDYYSNSYAVNQYLAAHGFVVLSVNYRLGIGYGRAFHHPEHAGFAGASEYQDVLAGARFLQSLPGVDPTRIGIWGGSYGGYLTALALARNSDIFKTGVDWHGVHDWTRLMDGRLGKPDRYEKGDRDEAMETAWNSSPDANVDAWKSPVLLVQGDDDRNVPFQQTIDLARRLDARNIPYEELVLPNEIHGFLRHASLLEADQATAAFLSRTLGVASQ